MDKALWRRLWRPTVTAVLAFVAIMLLLFTAGCWAGEPTPEPGPKPVPPSVTTDPTAYEVYLAQAPPGERVLSEQDALGRAILGCGIDWPKDSVDAALANAYRPTGVCDQ